MRLSRSAIAGTLFAGCVAAALWTCRAQPRAAPGVAADDVITLAVRADITGVFPNPALDALIEAGNRTVSAQARTQALQRALARVAELRPLIPLLIQAEAVAVSPRVRREPSVRYSLHIQEMSPAR